MVLRGHQVCKGPAGPRATLEQWVSVVFQDLKDLKDLRVIMVSRDLKGVQGQVGRQGHWVLSEL